MGFCNFLCFFSYIRQKGKRKKIRRKEEERNDEKKTGRKRQKVINSRKVKEKCKRYKRKKG
jgi:hypothetical protein